MWGLDQCRARHWADEIGIPIVRQNSSRDCADAGHQKATRPKRHHESLQGAARRAHPKIINKEAPPLCIGIKSIARMRHQWEKGTPHAKTVVDTSADPASQTHALYAGRAWGAPHSRDRCSDSWWWPCWTSSCHQTRTAFQGAQSRGQRYAD